MSPLDSYAAAAAGFVRLVGQIADDAWPGPGLGEWDLRALVGHTSRSLVTVDTYLDRPAEREDVDSPEAYYVAAASLAAADPSGVIERGRQAGLALGDEPAARVAALARRVLPRAAAAGDPVIETIAGGMRLSRYLLTRTFELVVHGFDIARATGLAGPAEPELVAAAVTLAAGVAAARGKAPPRCWP